MQPYAPVDARGWPLQAGDWVRVLDVPPGLEQLADEDARADFRNAVGQTFRIVDFDAVGHLELQLWPKLPGMATIWLEPALTRRSRRAKSSTLA